MPCDGKHTDVNKGQFGNHKVKLVSYENGEYKRYAREILFNYPERRVTIWLTTTAILSLVYAFEAGFF